MSQVYQWRNKICHLQVVEKLLLKDCFGSLFLMLALFHLKIFIKWFLKLVALFLLQNNSKITIWIIALLIAIIRHDNLKEEGHRSTIFNKYLSWLALLSSSVSITAFNSIPRNSGTLLWASQITQLIIEKF